MKHRIQVGGCVVVGCGMVAAALVGAAQANPTAATSAKRATVATVKTPLGRVVSTSSGRVMFRFLKDHKGSSTCSPTCRAVWPPVTSKSAARAGSHIAAKHLGRTGKGQVTYYGHPLYLYVGDPKPGRTKGDGIKEFGDKWYVVSPRGKSVKPKKTGGGGRYRPVVPTTAPAISTSVEGSSSVVELSDSAGFTLYALASETSTTQLCTDVNMCIPAFTPVLTDAANDTPTVSGTADATKVGTFAREFGNTTVNQVTYHGHPLYRYAGDAKAGDDNGQWKNTGGQFWGGVFPTGAINQALSP